MTCCLWGLLPAGSQRVAQAEAAVVFYKSQEARLTEDLRIVSGERSKLYAELVATRSMADMRQEQHSHELAKLQVRAFLLTHAACC